MRLAPSPQRHSRSAELHGTANQQLNEALEGFAALDETSPARSGLEKKMPSASFSIYGLLSAMDDARASLLNFLDKSTYQRYRPFLKDLLKRDW